MHHELDIMQFAVIMDAMQEHGCRNVLIVIAHPDDESFGCGALIAAEAAARARVVVCCASRGELGEDVSGRYQTRDALGVAREAELREAAEVLGVAEVELLGLTDSGRDGDPEPGSIVAEPSRLCALVSEVMVRHRPDVVVTLDPTGSDGHRDHAAVGRATTVAFDDVVDWPAALYHWCLPHSLMDAWSREIAAAEPDSVYLGTELGRADADVTTVLDGAAVLDVVHRAVAAHRTQASPYAAVNAGLAERFMRFDHLVRQQPAWDGGPAEDRLR
ncbi:MAG TPA: PIG-L family deacetylase [Marmoricola sp.]